MVGKQIGWCTTTQFELWLMWRSKVGKFIEDEHYPPPPQGMEGYRRQINRLMELTKYFTAKIKAVEGYEMVVDEVDIE